MEENERVMDDELKNIEATELFETNVDSNQILDGNLRASMTSDQFEQSDQDNSPFDPFRWWKEEIRKVPISQPECDERFFAEIHEKLQVENAQLVNDNKQLHEFKKKVGFIEGLHFDRIIPHKTLSQRRNYNQRYFLPHPIGELHEEREYLIAQNSLLCLFEIEWERRINVNKTFRKPAAVPQISFEEAKRMFELWNQERNILDIEKEGISLHEYLFNPHGEQNVPQAVFEKKSTFNFYRHFNGNGGYSKSDRKWNNASNWVKKWQLELLEMGIIKFYSDREVAEKNRERKNFARRVKKNEDY